MRDTLTIESLLRAFENYYTAAREEEAAREAYEGRSWGYHGARYVEAKEQAAEDVQKRLDDYIDSRLATLQ